MKLTRYQVAGITKIHSKKNDKDYTLLELVSEEYYTDNYTDGHKVATAYGNGTEKKGDILTCIFINGKTKIIETKSVGIKK